LPTRLSLSLGGFVAMDIVQPSSRSYVAYGTGPFPSSYPPRHEVASAALAVIY